MYRVCDSTGWYKARALAPGLRERDHGDVLDGRHSWPVACSGVGIGHEDARNETQRRAVTAYESPTGRYAPRGRRGVELDAT